MTQRDRDSKYVNTSTHKRSAGDAAEGGARVQFQYGKTTQLVDFHGSVQISNKTCLIYYSNTTKWEALEKRELP